MTKQNLIDAIDRARVTLQRDKGRPVTFAPSTVRALTNEIWSELRNNETSVEHLFNGDMRDDEQLEVVELATSDNLSIREQWQN